jgi:LacI family transcriptional regulator
MAPTRDSNGRPHVRGTTRSVNPLTSIRSSFFSNFLNLRKRLTFAIFYPVEKTKRPLEERRATIQDVARAAGVSTATVSNVLRGNRFVSPPLQQRVQDAISSLQYNRNPLAMGLRTQRSGIVGVVVPDITIGFFSAIVRRIETRAAYTDYQIVLADSQEDPEWEQKRVAALLGRHIDGLIFIPCRDDTPALADLRATKTPIILVDRVGRDSRFDSVSADNTEASFEGTRYLISLGHRKICFVADNLDLRNIKERIEGYSQAMRDAKLSKFEQIILTDVLEVEGKMRAMEPILASRDRPTAVFAATELLTLAALKLISELRIDFPKDISLLGFDDSEWLTAMRPYVSTVSQPAGAFADEAWDTLVSRLNKDRSPKLHREVHCRLIKRESTVRYRR